MSFGIRMVVPVRVTCRNNEARDKFCHTRLLTPRFRKDDNVIPFCILQVTLRGCSVLRDGSQHKSCFCSGSSEPDNSWDEPAGVSGPLQV